MNTVHLDPKGVNLPARLPSFHHILCFQARTVAALSGSGKFKQIFQTDFSNLHLRMLGISTDGLSPNAESSNDVLTKFRKQYKGQFTVKKRLTTFPSPSGMSLK
jgi:hypothetical protein